MRAKKSFLQSLRSQWKQWMGYGIALVIGLVGGGLAGRVLGGLMADSESPGVMLMMMGVALLGVYLGLLLQIAVHEAGHLVAGLMSGYRFVSYRIGSFMWVKQEGRIRLRRFSLAGTGGQCLMAPPDLIDGRMPVILYNMGGAIMNVLSSLPFLALWQLSRPLPGLSAFFLVLAIIGVISALSNGLPLRLGQIDNDGYNAFSLGKNPAAMRSLWVQLKVNEQQVLGARLKDMPQEWFTLPAEADRVNSMATVPAVLAANRLLDEGRFDEADALIRQLEEGDYNLIGIHRSLLECDRLYLELVGANRADVVRQMNTPALKKFMKAMKSFPSVLRTRYALALLADRDTIQADRVRAEFDRMALNFPESGTIEAEREWMQRVDERR